MSPRTACLRSRLSRSLGFEQLEDRRLLSGTSLLGSAAPSPPLSLTATVNIGAPLLGVSVSADVQTSGNAPLLSVTAAVTSSSSTTSVSPTSADLALQTPLASVSTVVGVSDGSTGGGGTGGGSLLGGSSGGGSITAGTGQPGSGSLSVGFGNTGSGGQVTPPANGGGNTSGGQAPGMYIPPSTLAAQSGAGSTVGQAGAVPATQPAAGTDPSPFLVPAFLDAAPAGSQSAVALALAREATEGTPSLALATLPGMSTVSFAGESEANPALGAAPSAAESELTHAALRAASYNLDEPAEEELPVEDQPLDEAAEAGLMGVVPADGSGIDLSLSQLLDELKNLGHDLNQALPGGLAFWVLAGAVGLTGCVVVRRRQAARAVLAGDALAWIPSLTGFLPRE